jgi:hypothetical protein
MSTDQNTGKSWLGNLISKFLTWVNLKAKPEIHDFAVVADKVGNAFKASEASPTGLLHLFEVALPMIIPASTGLVNAFQFALAKIVTDLDLAVAETSKTGDQIIMDGLKKLESLKGTEDYAIKMHSFAAKVQMFFSNNLQLGLTIEQALTLPAIVHDPTLSKIATEVVQDIKGASQVVDSVVKETEQTINSAQPGNTNTPG